MSMERVMDVTAARRQFGTLLDEVFYKGDAVTVLREGKPMARIVPMWIYARPLQDISKKIMRDAVLDA